MLYALCRENTDKSKIVSHFAENLDINIETTKLNFSSFEDFMHWMAEIGKKKSKFIRYGSKRQTYYFKCHRSGCFEPKDKGIRHLKISGSNKIDAYCPASIKVTHSEGGECIVNFVSTHVGHSNDITHIFLTDDERKSLAIKIASKVPYDTILNEIRDSNP